MERHAWVATMPAAKRTHALILSLASGLAFCAACSDAPDSNAAQLAPVPSVMAPPAIAGMPAVAIAGAPATADPAGTAGTTALAPVAGMGGMAAQHPHDATMGAAGAMADPLSQCKLHVAADPRDAMLSDQPMIVTAGFQQDALLPQIVLDWMDENQFAEAHDGWHLVRKWDQTCRKSNATTCTASGALTRQGLERAPIQQGAPGDGAAFMMMHRHMFMMLHTAFPNHTKLFAGFTKVPRSKDDPENPHPWGEINWSSNNMRGFEILENIEQHLDQFATEDDLGQFIENTYRWTAQSPMSPVNMPGSGLHGALHSQWAVSGSPANLIQQAVDVKNFAFWKLHGWIDSVWERYRVAKGLKNDDPAYQQLMLEQCNEMFALEPRNRKPGQSGPGTVDPGTSAPETGEFATRVRPFLDSSCAGCHGPIAPTAGMTLGGTNVSSAEVIAGLVGAAASNGEYKLIEPGAPDKSWVYLKASGGVATVACARACDRQAMPPSGTGLSATQLASLRQWIMNGATDK
ncbi:MAG TPA: hypothetical protein VK524_29415 [Polyangiaceae bacterium]|nr:hypothetical protein [Polyangiaceae bacterium]